MNTSALILLAGGLASRLGADKALYPVAGKPMIKHIITRVSGLTDEVLVVIARNRSRSQYSEILPDFKVINDEIELKSPLVGIITGLRAAKAQYAIVLSCDIPFVNRQVIQLLLERASDAEAVVPRSRTGHLEPLQAVYHRESMLHEAEEALAKEQLSPIAVIHNLARVVYVSIEDEIRVLDPDLRTFFNVNTKQDIAKAETMLGQQHHSSLQVD
jgi:molybdopterin-guanine dinucleotide biosynthesis protein A